jgi:hypothetical protein
VIYERQKEEKPHILGLKALNWPIAISRKNKGMPTKKSIVKNGTRKAAPPFLNTKKGKRQTLPRPKTSNFLLV